MLVPKRLWIKRQRDQIFYPMKDKSRYAENSITYHEYERNIWEEGEHKLSHTHMEGNTKVFFKDNRIINVNKLYIGSASDLKQFYYRLSHVAWKDYSGPPSQMGVAYQEIFTPIHPLIFDIDHTYNIEDPDVYLTNHYPRRDERIHDVEIYKVIEPILDFVQEYYSIDNTICVVTACQPTIDDENLPMKSKEGIHIYFPNIFVDRKTRIAIGKHINETVMDAKDNFLFDKFPAFDKDPGYRGEFVDMQMLKNGQLRLLCSKKRWKNPRYYKPVLKLIYLKDENRWEDYHTYQHEKRVNCSYCSQRQQCDSSRSHYHNLFNFVHHMRKRDFNSIMLERYRLLCECTGRLLTDDVPELTPMIKSITISKDSELFSDENYQQIDLSNEKYKEKADAMKCAILAIFNDSYNWLKRNWSDVMDEAPSVLKGDKKFRLRWYTKANKGFCFNHPKTELEMSMEMDLKRVQSKPCSNPGCVEKPTCMNVRCREPVMLNSAGLRFWKRQKIDLSERIHDDVYYNICPYYMHSSNRSYFAYDDYGLFIFRNYHCSEDITQQEVDEEDETNISIDALSDKEKNGGRACMYKHYCLYLRNESIADILGIKNIKRRWNGTINERVCPLTIGMAKQQAACEVRMLEALRQQFQFKEWEKTVDGTMSFEKFRKEGLISLVR